MQIQIFLRTFPICVPNTGDNDVMYLSVYINNKAVVLLLMSIYNKNQATVSQNHTKDCSRLSNEDDDVRFTGTYNL